MLLSICAYIYVCVFVPEWQLLLGVRGKHAERKCLGRDYLQNQAVDFNLFVFVVVAVVVIAVKLKTL